MTDVMNGPIAFNPEDIMELDATEETTGRRVIKLASADEDGRKDDPATTHLAYLASGKKTPTTNSGLRTYGRTPA